MSINATLIGQAIWFALFIWITMKFVWPPLARAMAERQRHIADGLAAAERGKAELADSAKRADEELVVARNRAAELIAQAEKRAAQIVEESKNAAKAEGEREKAAAAADIVQQMNSAKEQLRAQVAAIAMAGAAKILKREVDQKVHAAMLTELQAELK